MYQRRSTYESKYPDTTDHHGVCDCSYCLLQCFKKTLDVSTFPPAPEKANTRMKTLARREPSFTRTNLEGTKGLRTWTTAAAGKHRESQCNTANCWLGKKGWFVSRNCACVKRCQMYDAQHSVVWSLHNVRTSQCSQIYCYLSRCQIYTAPAVSRRLDYQTPCFLLTSVTFTFLSSLLPL